MHDTSLGMRLALQLFSRGNLCDLVVIKGAYLYSVRKKLN